MVSQAELTFLCADLQSGLAKMGRAPSLEPLPSYATVCLAFYGGAPAPGAPVVPMPLLLVSLSSDLFPAASDVLHHWHTERKVWCNMLHSNLNLSTICTPQEQGVN